MATFARRPKKAAPDTPSPVDALRALQDRAAAFQELAEMSPGRRLIAIASPRYRGIPLDVEDYHAAREALQVELDAAGAAASEHAVQQQSAIEAEFVPQVRQLQDEAAGLARRLIEIEAQQRGVIAALAQRGVNAYAQRVVTLLPAPALREWLQRTQG